MVIVACFVGFEPEPRRPDDLLNGGIFRLGELGWPAVAPGALARSLTSSGAVGSPSAAESTGAVALVGLAAVGAERAGELGGPRRDLKAPPPPSVSGESVDELLRLRT